MWVSICLWKPHLKSDRKLLTLAFSGKFVQIEPSWFSIRKSPMYYQRFMQSEFADGVEMIHRPFESHVISLA